ncbi:winged helix-turn-helix transcriptional regulator [Nonomuraea sp. H19]|uniref:winged helix-turn-helix transcriptional regulator n=1 Tax=Nonomuraea sp. H19 TaxID=3452206 RepID=UPI003F8CB6EF
MLTQTLRSLERDGLVTRTVTPTVPVTVTYELTDLGLLLHHVMGRAPARPPSRATWPPRASTSAMCAWASRSSPAEAKATPMPSPTGGTSSEVLR